MKSSLFLLLHEFFNKSAFIIMILTIFFQIFFLTLFLCLSAENPTTESSVLLCRNNDGARFFKLTIMVGSIRARVVRSLARPGEISG